MPNPVRAARKAGRQNLKDLKQNIRAEKITKKFEAKADKIGMKNRAAISAAKSAAQAKAGVRPSTVSKIEPLKKNLQVPAAAPLKFELAKPSASAIAAKEAAFKPTPKPAPKKKTSSKKKTTPKPTTDRGPFKLPEETIFEAIDAGKNKEKRTIFTDAEKKRIAEANAYLKKEQAKREANQKAEQEQQNKRETRRLFRGPVTMTYRKNGGSVKRKK